MDYKFRDDGNWRRPKAEDIPRFHGQTLGLILFGRIAKAVAKIASGFDMRILAYDPYVLQDYLCNLWLKTIRRFIMPLDEEQKKALKEEYKKHRRAVWRGETSRSKKDVIENREDDLETVIDIIPEEPIIDDSRTDSSQRKRSSPFDEADAPTEIIELEEETTIVDNRPIGEKLEYVEQKKSEIDQPQQSYSDFHSETQSVLVEKIKAQRRATWAGESSALPILKDKGRKRKNFREERKSRNEPDEKQSGITWKLALAVIIGITGAIGLGVFLGYFLASYL